MKERGHRQRLNNVRVVVYLNKEISDLVDAKLYSPILDKPLTGARGNIISALLRIWLQADGNTAALSHAWQQYKILNTLKSPSDPILEDQL